MDGKKNKRKRFALSSTTVENKNRIDPQIVCFLLFFLLLQTTTATTITHGDNNGSNNQQVNE